MKKLSFYVMALAFCVLLVGAVAVSSPIEAGAYDTVGSAYADVYSSAFTGAKALLTTGDVSQKPEGEVQHEYWTVSQTGNVTAYEGEGVPDSSSYMHIGKSEDGSTIILTLHNVAPAECSYFRIVTGNVYNVELVLEGENVLRGDYGDAALQAKNNRPTYTGPAPSLTTSGDGTLTCYGADIVEESEESGRIDEVTTRASGDEDDYYFSYGIYAEGDFTVKAGATVTGIGGDIDVEEADMAESYGIYAEGNVKVEKGAELIGTGGDVSGNATMLFSGGVNAAGNLMEA